MSNQDGDASQQAKFEAKAGKQVRRARADLRSAKRERPSASSDESNVTSVARTTKSGAQSAPAPRGGLRSEEDKIVEAVLAPVVDSFDANPVILAESAYEPLRSCDEEAFVRFIVGACLRAQFHRGGLYGRAWRNVVGVINIGNAGQRMTVAERYTYRVALMTWRAYRNCRCEECGEYGHFEQICPESDDAATVLDSSSQGGSSSDDDMSSCCSSDSSGTDSFTTEDDSDTETEPPPAHGVMRIQPVVTAPPPVPVVAPEPEMDTSKFRAQASYFNLSGFVDRDHSKSIGMPLYIVYTVFMMFYLIFATEYPLCENVRTHGCEQYTMLNAVRHSFNQAMAGGEPRAMWQSFLLAQRVECLPHFDIIGEHGSVLNGGVEWWRWNFNARAIRAIDSLLPEALTIGDPKEFTLCVARAAFTDDVYAWHNALVRLGRYEFVLQGLYLCVSVWFWFHRRRVHYSFGARYCGPTLHDLRATDVVSRDILLGDAHYCVVRVFELTGTARDVARAFEGGVWREEIVSIELFIALMNARFSVDARDPDKLYTAMCQRAGIEDRIAMDRYVNARHDVAASTARCAFYYKMSLTRHLPLPGQ